MSKNDLENLKASLLELPKEEVNTPNMPVEVAIQEGEDLYVWAGDDKEKLTGAGLDWTLAESIPERAGACREAQSEWAKDYKSREEAEKEWLQNAPEGFTLRDSLLHAFRYAYRNDDTLLAKVAVIAEGSSREDLIQDLNDLAVLGKANPAPLEGINFDLAQIDLAAERSDKLAALLAGAKSETETASEAYDLRNRAYAYLKEAVDEVRACGKYIFWNNEERLKGYRSEFYHRKNVRNRNKTNGENEVAA